MGLAKVLVAAGLGLAALVAAPLVVREALQWREARASAITAPRGVQEGGFVDVDGSAQWVQIRGEDRANPVVLVVHGGPGFAMSSLTPVFRAWESDFTVVQWDQRNAGRTFRRNGAEPISIGRVAQDGLAVAAYVRRRLPEAPIILLGHSWGSAVGLEMIRRRPERFAAFVGTGQMSSKREQEALSYRLVLEKLRATHNQEGLSELRRIGPPPYDGLAELLVQRKWLSRVDIPEEQDLFREMAPLVLTAPGMSLRDVRAYLAAPEIAQAASYDEVSAFEARDIGRRFRTPIFILAGDRDLYAPVAPTIRYLAEVDAPRKDVVVLEGGHDVMLTRPQAFLNALRSRVRPYLLAEPADR